MGRVPDTTARVFTRPASEARNRRLLGRDGLRLGSTVISDWKKGSKIVFKGEWKGKPYEDKGLILQLDPGKRLQYSHFSPLMGKPDTPENYHTVTIDLASEGKRSRVSLTQDNNDTEETRDHSAKNWEMMLTGLKKYVEGRTTRVRP